MLYFKELMDLEKIMPDLNVFHDSRSRVFREPFGAVKAGEKVTLRLYLSGADAANASADELLTLIQERNSRCKMEK